MRTVQPDPSRVKGLRTPGALILRTMVAGDVVLALYDEKAQALLRRWPVEQHEALARRLGVCESPIEVLFALALLSARGATGAPVFTLYTGDDDGELLATNPQFHLFAQHNVTVEGRRVRLDFALVPVGATGPKLAVELDGHAFHSSKEALTSDASRDRALLRAGWTPIRFRGGEAWADPDACAAEVFASAKCKVLPADPVTLASEAAHLAECNAVFGDDVPIRLNATERQVATAQTSLVTARAAISSAPDRAAASLRDATAAIDAIPPPDLGRVLRAVVDGLRDDITELSAVLRGDR